MRFFAKTGVKMRKIHKMRKKNRGGQTARPFRIAGGGTGVNKKP